MNNSNTIIKGWRGYYSRLSAPHITNKTNIICLNLETQTENKHKITQQQTKKALKRAKNSSGANFSSCLLLGS